MPKRFWSVIAALSMMAMLGMAISIGPERLEVTRHDLRADTRRPGLRVVQVSDLHLQAIGSRERDVIRQVRALKPDLLVLSGDMVDRADALPLLAEFMDALGPMRTVAVPGNWEHWSGADLRALCTLFASRKDCRFLINERWTFTDGDRTVTVIGLDDFTAGRPDPDLLTQETAADVTLLVQHSPGYFESEEVIGQPGMGGIDLCLSGHTHGGQVALWGWAPLRPRGSGGFTAGFYDVAGCPLYVSRGIGTSVLPVRWGAAPEVAVFEL